MPRFHCVSVEGLAVLLCTLALSVATCAADTEQVIYNFTGGNDEQPVPPIGSRQRRHLFGTTVLGGLYGCGTVFELNYSGSQWNETVLYSFDCYGTGKNPYGGVTVDNAGNLYGTTVAGGSGGECTGDGCGVADELTRSGDTWNETVLYNFTGGDDGFGPGSAVVFDKAGNLYGATPDGGVNAEGVVYQLSPGQQAGRR